MSQDISQDAAQLHAESIVVDGCSFFLRRYNERIEESGVTAVNFTVPMINADVGGAVTAISDYHSLARRDSKIEIAWSVRSIQQCKREGKLAAIIGCQNSRFIGTELGHAEMFARLGLRIMQLTYNERNFVADGCLEPNDAGVSFFGKKLIMELNRIGIIIDLSHAGRKSSLDAIKVSQAPVIMSHVGVRSRVDSPRAITDEQLRAVAETGGVVGITSHPNFNWQGGPERPHLNDFIDSLEYAIELIGIKHVGIGTDYVVEPNGYPQAVKDYLSHTYDPYVSDTVSQAQGLREVMKGLDPREDQLEGFRGMQDLPLVTGALLDRGYTAEQVQKVLGGNFMRVFGETWND